MGALQTWHPGRHTSLGTEFDPWSPCAKPVTENHLEALRSASLENTAQQQKEGAPLPQKQSRREPIPRKFSSGLHTSMTCFPPPRHRHTCIHTHTRTKYVKRWRVRGRHLITSAPPPHTRHMHRQNDRSIDLQKPTVLFATSVCCIDQAKQICGNACVHVTLDRSSKQ